MVDPIQIVRDLRKLDVNNPPKTLFWAIINYCNAVCTTCRFYLVPRSSWKYVHFDDAKKAVDILCNNGFRMTALTGGEPLMNPDVFEICDYLHKKDIVITYMPTNGILVTRSVARRLKDADIRLVGISVDLDDGGGMGLTRKIPNLRKVAIHARECLEEVGIKTYAGVLLTRSALDISRILKSVTDLGFSKVVFSYPQLIQSSSYKASNEMQELLLNVNDIERSVEDIKLAKKNFKGISVHNPNESLNNLVRFYQGVPRKYRCYGGSNLFYLDWNLDLYRCFTLEKKYGNLLELGRVDFEEEPCDLCSQQAFRDHDPFYYLASTLVEFNELLRQGHPLSAAKLLVKKDTRDAIHALHEFLSGGFV